VRILSRYYVTSYLGLFISILFASMIVIAIVELLLNFEEILEDHPGFTGLATYLFLRLPTYYFRDLIPVVSFAAAFFCLGLAARRHEITAVKTGGVSPHRMVIPILAAATVLSGATLVLGETVVLSATRALVRLQTPGEEIMFRRGSFWYHRGDIIYNVREADRKRKTLHGVRIFETSPLGRLLQSTQSDFVEIDEKNRWHLRDATVRTFDPATPTAPPRVERRSETVLDVAAEHDLARLDASAKTLSLGELRAYIRARTDEGRDVEVFRGILSARLTDPLTVIVFALVAIPLGLSVEHHRSLATAAVIGIATLGLFYTARTAASLLSAAALTPATFTPWIVISAFAGFALVRLARIPR
jgi:lipopolysaccharide export system permease protein